MSAILRSPVSPQLLPIGSPEDDPDQVIESVRRVARLAAQGGHPPHDIEPRDVPRWFANFVITPEKRRFSFDDRPWLPELCVASVTEKEMVEQKASQVGASVRNLAGSFYLMARRFFRAGVAYFFPTDNDLKDLSTTKADPLIHNSYLVDLSDVESNNLYRKSVGGVWIYFRGSKATIRLKSFSVDMVVIDEADEIPAEAQKMAEQRMHASEIQWLRHFSKPSVPSYGIARSFERSDQRYWTIRCGGCRKDFAFEDGGGTKDAVFPACVSFTRSGEAFRCCPKCKREVFLEDGRWVARNPGARVVGYSISQMLSPQIDPGELVRDFEDTDRIAEFWRGRMGVPYVDPSGSVSQDQVLKTCGDHANARESALPTFLGVDVGRRFHWVAKRRAGTKLRTVGIGTCRSFSEMREVALALRCEKGVMDALPEAHAAIAFSQAPGLRGKWWLCHYDTGKHPAPAKWVEDEERRYLKVTAHRNATLDRVLASYREGLVELPRRDPIVEEFAKHVAALVRNEQTDDETGEVTTKYIQTGPDHWGHADGYANLAAGEWRGPMKSFVVWGG